MSILTKTSAPLTEVIKTAAFKEKYTVLMKQLDFSYFAFISFCIPVSACLGGALVKFSLENNSVLWQFILGAFLSIMNIVVCVSQFPVKWVFNVFISSTVVNISLILISFS